MVVTSQTSTVQSYPDPLLSSTISSNYQDSDILSLATSLYIDYPPLGTVDVAMSDLQGPSALNATFDVPRSSTPICVPASVSTPLNSDSASVSVQLHSSDPDSTSPLELNGKLLPPPPTSPISPPLSFPQPTFDDLLGDDEVESPTVPIISSINLSPVHAAPQQVLSSEPPLQTPQLLVQTSDRLDSTSFPQTTESSSIDDRILMDTTDSSQNPHELSSSDPQTSSSPSDTLNDIASTNESTSSGVPNLMLGGGGGDVNGSQSTCGKKGRGGRGGGARSSHSKVGVTSANDGGGSNQPSTKRTKRGLWGLSKGAFDRRITAFKYLVNMINYQSGKKTNLELADLNAVYIAIRHIESNLKKRSLYLPCSQNFSVFEPPDTFKHPRKSFFQPQLISGVLTIVASCPYKGKGLVQKDRDTIVPGYGVAKGKRVEGLKHCMCIFSFMYDPAIEVEIRSRIHSLPNYANVKVEYFSFFKTNPDSDFKAVGSLIFVLWLMLLFLEGSYCLDDIQMKVSNTHYKYIHETVLSKIDFLSKRKWNDDSIPSKIGIKRIS